jgi:hypothetical protein
MADETETKKTKKAKETVEVSEKVAKKILACQSVDELQKYVSTLDIEVRNKASGYIAEALDKIIKV